MTPTEQAILRRFVNGLSPEEIAAGRGCAAQTVRNALANVKDRCAIPGDLTQSQTALLFLAAALEDGGMAVLDDGRLKRAIVEAK